MKHLPILHDLNDGVDKLCEAQQFVELIYLATYHDKPTAAFSVGANRASNLLTEALAFFESASTALRCKGVTEDVEDRRGQEGVE